VADDRPVGDVVDELGALKKLVEDMRTTLMARTSRRPTGDIEPTIRTTAKPDTLILDGSTPLRADYPVLWQWVQDQSLILTGLFTVGNGTTTFGLPDWRGKVLRGKAAAEAVGQAVGSDSLTLSTAQLPSHSHTAGNAGNHGHSFSTDGAGSHGGHNSGSFGVAAGSGGAVSSNGDTSGGFHSHTGGTTNVADHTHTIGSTGSGSSVDVRQASVAVNWLVYT
jgi:microcystin-dependent protein